VSPRRRRDADQLQQILDAGVELIAEQGVAGTRLSDIARRADTSVGVLQHYFGGRDDLLVAVFAHLNRRTIEAATIFAAQAADAWAGVQSLLRFALQPQDDTDEWPAWFEYWAACARNPALRLQGRQLYEAWEQPLVQVIGWGVKNGDFRPVDSPETTARLLLALVDGLAIRSSLAVPLPDGRSALDLLDELARRLLGTQGRNRQPKVADR
jgi:AcrR family transcriptional regulator